MIKAIVPFPARFLVLLVLGFCCVACHAKYDHHHCEPSSCGDIHNISDPFRLDHDLNKCGKSRYQLSCENNVTVLYLYSGRYYVLAINYRNATIRVVDANIRKNNCSSLPQNSLARFIFSYYSDPYSLDVWKGTHRLGWNWFELSKPMVFLTCETRPLNNSHLYVDTIPCINATSGYSFLITESINASNLWDSCLVELMVTPSWSINGTKDMTTNRSYMDIHNQLLYGFELSWLHSYHSFHIRNVA